MADDEIACVVLSWKKGNVLTAFESQDMIAKLKNLQVKERESW